MENDDVMFAAVSNIDDNVVRCLRWLRFIAIVLVIKCFL